MIMIGFSASFAKAIGIILNEISNKTYHYIFSKIVSATAEGKDYVFIDMYENEDNLNEIIKNLRYNGFDIYIIEDKVTVSGKYMLFKIEW